MELKVSENLEALIWPSSEEESRLLEQRLLQTGRYGTIYIWRDIVLGGMQYYQLCQAHGIPFQTQEVHLKNWEEVIIWVCKDQLRRSDLPDEMRKYLIGKRYTAEKIVAARNYVKRNQYSSIPPEGKMRNRPSGAQHRTAAPLGEEYNLCCTTIQKYGAFSTAIDRIAAIDSAMRMRLLSGQMWISHDNIVILAGMNDIQIKLMIAFLKETNKSHFQAEDLKQIVGYTDASKKNVGWGHAQTSVKNMPQYDPDTEVLGLALTLPSWCTSVRRIQNTADLNGISEAARNKLRAGLRVLQDEIASILDVIREGASL